MPTKKVTIGGRSRKRRRRSTPPRRRKKKARPTKEKEEIGKVLTVVGARSPLSSSSWLRPKPRGTVLKQCLPVGFSVQGITALRGVNSARTVIVGIATLQGRRRSSNVIRINRHRTT